ncbi:DMT family transporter [Eionea flava]
MPVWFYIFLGVVVNCLWGTAFLIPHYLSDINPIAISMGRYLVYGLVSLFLALFTLKKLRQLTVRQWRYAFLFAFLGNVGYYLCMALSVHYGGITTAALVEGVTPLMMILAGCIFAKSNDKDFGFQSLLLPFLMVLTGVVLLKQSYVPQGVHAATDYSWYLGFFFAIAALLLWVWYAFSNAGFMKENPEVSASTWSVAIGVGCFFQAVLGATVFSLLSEGSLVRVGASLATPIMSLVAACLFLGVIVSWLATVWWNQVSRHIPIMIIGPLCVFETLSSLFYGYLNDQRLPGMGEILAIFLMVGGVLLSMLVMSGSLKKPALVLQEG